MSNLKSAFITGCCLWAFFGSTASDVMAQAKGKTNGATQQQQEQAKQALEILQEDAKQLAQAEQQMAAAMSTVKKAVKSVDESEKKAQAQLERSMGLDKLLAEQRAAKREVKDASDPLLEEFHKSDTYAHAKAKADAAKQRLSQLKSNSNLSADEKSRAERDAADESMSVSRAEQEFLENHPKVKDLKANATKIDKEMAALRAKIHHAVDNDNGVQTAEVELEKARAEFKQASKAVALLRQKAGFDRAVAVKEQQEAQMSQLLDRMKSQKGGGKGRKR